MNDPHPSSRDEHEEEQREHSMDDATTIRMMGVLIGGMALLALVIFIGVNIYF